MALDPTSTAILMLEDEITQLRSLCPTVNDVGNIYWWCLQAKSLGLSHLKSLQAQGITDPLQADQVRQSYRKELQPAAMAASKGV